MVIQAPRSRRAALLAIAATYAAWLIAGGLALAVCAIWHTALLNVYVALRLDKYGLAAFNDVAVIVIALGWLTFVLVTEARFRHAAAHGLLRRRFLRVVAVCAALIVMGWVLQLLV